MRKMTKNLSRKLPERHTYITLQRGRHLAADVSKRMESEPQGNTTLVQ